MATPIRVVLAGLGDFGARHAAALASNRGSELVGVVGRDSERTAEFARRLDVAAWSTDPARLLADEQPDAVVIAAPGATHLELTQAALDAGASVLLEKPVVPGADETDALRRAAEAAPGFVMPAHVLRFAAPYRELHRRVRSGHIGQVTAFAFRRYRGADHDRRFPDMHPAFMTAIHDIDLAIWLSRERFSAVTVVTGDAPSTNQPAALFAHARTGSGTAVSFSVSWLLPDNVAEDALELFGTEGMLGLDRDFVLRERSTTANEVTRFAGYDLDDALQAEIDHFIGCVAAGQASEVITLDDAIHGIELADAMTRSPHG